VRLHQRYGLTLCVVAAAALGLAACGTTSYGSGTTSTTRPPVGHSSSSTVGSRTIAPVGAVLIGSNGRTLYYLSTETSTAIQCTGACTSTWTPYVVAKASSPTKSASVHGSLSTTTRPNGAMQVTFNGHPVYFYAGDSGPGQAKGQGVQGTWFVLSTASSPGAQNTTTTTTGTNYGY